MTIFLFAALVGGTVVGHDDAFPLGPFRMFANSTKVSGAISVPVLSGRLSNGDVVPLYSSSVGLRRAELESRLDLFVEDPNQLARFAAAWRRDHPDSPPLVEVRLERRRRTIVDRRPVGDPTYSPLAVWRADG